jgi:hypothetical protein
MNNQHPEPAALEALTSDEGALKQGNDARGWRPGHGHRDDESSD